MKKLAICLCYIFLSYQTLAASPPNIIIILADDLGYGDLGCYGHEKFKTPRLDQMAAEGVRFTQFNAPMPFCAPSRASLLTGRYPSRCGMTNNPCPDGSPESDNTALPQSELLLGQFLKKAGYKTAMIGKWHLGHKKPESLPTHRGFDEYLGILYSNDMRPVQLIEAERVVEYPVVQAKLTKSYTERAIDFIKKSKDRPFFLYLAHAMPHKPLAASEAFYKKSGAGLYGDVIAELDWSTGRILDTLQMLGLDKRTFVIFTSDNGPYYGGSTGGFRGMKATTFEGGYRVPLIARWPGQIPERGNCRVPAVMMDIFTTAMAIAGQPLPKDRVIDGKDLLPYMKEPNKKWPKRYIFGQRHEILACIRDDRWKLHPVKPKNRKPLPPDNNWVDRRAPDGVTILAPYEQYDPSYYPGLSTGDDPKPMMLFDLENDPGEQCDVAKEHPEALKRLQDIYDAFKHEISQ